MGTVLTITEHPIPGYAARTRYNARAADLTVAIALNFDTPGEQLTRSAAGFKYIAIPFCQHWLLGDVLGPADIICREIDRWRARVLNIAGNGIYTLSRNGISQSDVDSHLFDILALVVGQRRVDKVVTGGQTGMDIAGAVAAVAAGVERVDVRMPRRFIQRLADGRDVARSEREVRQEIESAAQRLLGVEVAR